MGSDEGTITIRNLSSSTMYYEMRWMRGPWQERKTLRSGERGTFVDRKNGMYGVKVINSDKEEIFELLELKLGEYITVEFTGLYCRAYHSDSTSILPKNNILIQNKTSERIRANVWWGPQNKFEVWLEGGQYSYFSETDSEANFDVVFSNSDGKEVARCDKTTLLKDVILTGGEEAGYRAKADTLKEIPQSGYPRKNILLRNDTDQQVECEVWWGTLRYKISLKSGEYTYFSDTDEPATSFNVVFKNNKGQNVAISAETYITAFSYQVILKGSADEGYGLTRSFLSPRCSSEVRQYHCLARGADAQFCYRDANVATSPAYSCGHLFTTQEGFSTGFIIHPRIIVTAGHAVKKLQVENGWFSPGSIANPKQPSRIYRLKKILLHPDYEPDGLSELDFGLVVTTDPMPENLLLTIDKTKKDRGTPVRVFGYPAGCSSYRMIEMKTKIRSVTDGDPDGQVYTCSVSIEFPEDSWYKGFSGGPCITDDNRVIGSVSAGLGTEQHYANLQGSKFQELYRLALKEL